MESKQRSPVPSINNNSNYNEYAMHLELSHCHDNVETNIQFSQNVSIVHHAYGTIICLITMTFTGEDISDE